ncbi:transmembrane amino acid transporter protein, putative [Cryptosporidium muris RN66]|uniref:Transmembrane amino acid transporter protein, putative n=1 Tax=Cryptosporidium muris (strain RN66) TaxID=441375 RepID=B6AK35_CRYMR|nr:transmembrane amino acid transporter protein, putative [Cryptosporidium muris RN66]EEA08576.1 transmembrane amino acid transporter protein, putative [Cryptosporidium muris RN66]|eukprot:XP_002142925.1 transmembrane amino acid transporter protein [Cryptosporidium muris RN66]
MYSEELTNKQDTSAITINETFESIETSSKSPGLEDISDICKKNIIYVELIIGFVTIFKAAIGTGILFSPKAFANSGYVSGTFLIIFYWFINVISIFTLLKCTNNMNYSYSEIATLAMGIPGRIMADLAITTTEISFTIVYISFITDNIQDIIAGIYNCSNNYMNYKPALITFIQLVLYIPLLCIDRVQSLGLIMILANICLIIGILSIIIYSSIELSNNILNGKSHLIPLYTNPNNAAGFIGIAAFLWVCAPVVLSYYNSLETLKSKLLFKWVYLFSIFLVLIFTLIFTFISTFAYGTNVFSPIILNLPFTVPAIIVKLLYILSVVFSLPLLLFPVKEIVKNYIIYILRYFNNKILKLSNNHNIEISNNNNDNNNDNNNNKHSINDYELSYKQVSSSISTIDFDKDENRLTLTNSNRNNLTILDRLKKVLLHCSIKMNKSTNNKVKSMEDNNKRIVHIYSSLIMILVSIFCTTMGYSFRNSLTNLVNIVGGVFCVPLNTILPSLFYLFIFKNKLNLGVVVFHSLIILIGILTSIHVIWYSIINWNVTSENMCSLINSNKTIYF